MSYLTEEIKFRITCLIEQKEDNEKQINFLINQNKTLKIRKTAYLKILENLESKPIKGGKNV